MSISFCFSFWNWDLRSLLIEEYLLEVFFFNYILLEGLKLLSSKLHILKQNYAQSAHQTYFDKCFSLEYIERKHISMANTLGHSSVHKLDDLIHLQLCLSYDTWSVTLYATPWPLSYDSVHKLNQQENGQVEFSYGRQPDILYCGCNIPWPVCFLIRIQTFQVCTRLLYIPWYSNKIREN